MHIRQLYLLPPPGHQNRTAPVLFGYIEVFLTTTGISLSPLSAGLKSAGVDRMSAAPATAIYAKCFDNRGPS